MRKNYSNAHGKFGRLDIFGFFRFHVSFYILLHHFASPYITYNILK